MNIAPVVTYDAVTILRMQCCEIWNACTNEWLTVFLVSNRNCKPMHIRVVLCFPLFATGGCRDHRGILSNMTIPSVIAIGITPYIFKIATTIGAFLFHWKSKRSNLLGYFFWRNLHILKNVLAFGIPQQTSINMRFKLLYQCGIMGEMSWSNNLQYCS